VGLKTLFLVALLVALAPASASAQRTTFQGVTECGRYGNTLFARHDPSFKRFVIDRESVEEDTFADHVGNQFVSTIYHGHATYEGSGGAIKVRFICLHGGIAKGPVFVYTLPE
jgi:hypothetical protein